MALRIEKLETAESNRSTEDEKKKEEPEQPIMMGQPTLMICGAGSFAAPPQAVRLVLSVLSQSNPVCRTPSDSRACNQACNQVCNREWACQVNMVWVAGSSKSSKLVTKPKI